MQNKQLYRLITFICILFLAQQVEARRANGFVSTLSDSSYISILTSSPSEEQVYTVFGHSAMRVYDKENNLDAVFNYGIFNFDSPNFIYRFVTGETDYMVVPYGFEHYLPEYAYRGVEVREQKLNLKQEEKQKVYDFLLENIKPENRVYRYSIFFNNCTTKLRDIVEEQADGFLNYPEASEYKTIRNMLHEHLVAQPWLKFGIDIIIAQGADRYVVGREILFLPIYEYDMLSKTTIKRGDKEEPIIAKDIQLLAPRNSSEEVSDFLLSPLQMGILLLVIMLFGAYLRLKNNSFLGRILHALYFLVAGLTGCVIFFLMFFSEHPCTDANWNLVWLNPLQLFAIALFFVKNNSKCAYYYHFANFAVLILFLLAWCLIPQELETSFIPYILSLIVISGTQILRHRKKVL